MKHYLPDMLGSYVQVFGVLKKFMDVSAILVNRIRNVTNVELVVEHRLKTLWNMTMLAKQY
jgi:hypothetical protein